MLPIQIRRERRGRGRNEASSPSTFASSSSSSSSFSFSFLVSFLSLLLLSSLLPLAVAEEPPRYPFSTVPLPEGDLFADIGLDTYAKALQAMFSLPPYNAVHPSLRSSDSDADCLPCIRHFSSHLVHTLMALVDDQCRTLNSELIKERCGWIGEHKHELEGYTIARSDVLSHGLTYCVGQRFCVTSNTTSLPFQLRYDLPSKEGGVVELASSMAWLDRARKETRSVVIYDENGTPSLLTENQVSNIAANAPPSCSSFDVAHLATPEAKCHACLNHGVRWAMRRFVRHVKHQCKTAADKEVFRAWCSWINNSARRLAVRGMIYSLVQPYKTAVGWCVGKEICSHALIHEHVGSLPFTMKGAIATREKNVGEKHTRRHVPGAPITRKRYH